GVGILVSEGPRATAAAYQLHDPDEVRRFLERLAEQALCSASRASDARAAKEPRALSEIQEEALQRRDWPDEIPEAPPEVEHPTVETGIPGSLAGMTPGEVNLLGPFAVPGLAPRLVRVYLPRGYNPAEPRFGLYLFDGQNNF